MVVVDLVEFSDEAFDPKRWINAALESRHPQDPIDRFLSDLEENLRSASEKISDSLERESSDALRRVPLAIRDVARLRDDAIQLRSAVSSILQKLKKVPPLSDYLHTCPFLSQDWNWDQINIIFGVYQLATEIVA